jgi:hypothetical protein
LKKCHLQEQFVLVLRLNHTKVKENTAGKNIKLSFMAEDSLIWLEMGQNLLGEDGNVNLVFPLFVGIIGQQPNPISDN